MFVPFRLAVEVTVEDILTRYAGSPACTIAAVRSFRKAMGSMWYLGIGGIGDFDITDASKVPHVFAIHRACAWTRWTELIS